MTNMDAMVAIDLDAITASGIVRIIDTALAPEAVRRPVHSLDEATTFRSALLYWRSRKDRSALRRAMCPPVDAIGDEVYDVGLAVVFRELAEISLCGESVGLVQTVIEINRRQVAEAEAHLRRQKSVELRQESVLAIGRLHGFLLVLETWKQDLLDEAGGVDDRGQS